MRILEGDITELTDVDAIVNAANGAGPMGRGVAGAIGFAGGLTLRNAVRTICQERGGFDAGECYVSPSGDLSSKGIKWVYHAVTMRYPGSPTSYDVISKAMRATLDRAVKDGVKSIAFPGLGTGVGELDVQRVAAIMTAIAESYIAKINVTLIDIDKRFVEFCKQSMQTEA